MPSYPTRLWRLLLLMEAVPLPAHAQDLWSAPAAWTATIFQAIMQFLNQPLSPLLALLVLCWTLVYLTFRSVLEKAGQPSRGYSHKIPVVAATILSMTAFAAYWSTPMIKGYLVAGLAGWTGFAVSTGGTVLLCAWSYTCIHRWKKTSLPPTP